MANPLWPASLPAAPRAGSSGKPMSNVISTKMETGAPKRRRRATRIVDLYDIQLRMSMAQWVTLKAFHRDTLKEVLPFDWVSVEDPDVAATYKFASPLVPRFLGRRVDVRFTLELQP